MTFTVTLEIKCRKPKGDEIEECGFDPEEIKELDLDSIEPREMVDALNGYFEQACDEFAVEVLAGSELPVVISSIKAKENQ